MRKVFKRWCSCGKWITVSVVGDDESPTIEAWDEAHRGEGHEALDEKQFRRMQREKMRTTEQEDRKFIRESMEKEKR